MDPKAICFRVFSFSETTLRVSDQYLYACA